MWRWRAKRQPRAIAAENLYQHAEHYFHIMNAEGQNPNIAPPQPMTPADTEMSGSGAEGDGMVPSGPRNASGLVGLRLTASSSEDADCAD